MQAYLEAQLAKGFRVWGVGFQVQCLGLKVQGVGRDIGFRDKRFRFTIRTALQGLSVWILWRFSSRAASFCS